MAVITNVSLEHTRILGDTTAAIAAEKAAIIKSGSTAVTGARDAAALAVIQDRARTMGVPLLRVGKDVVAEDMGGGEIELRAGSESIRATLGAAGSFQTENAGVAYGAVLGLRRAGLVVTPGHIRRALGSACIAGRFEIIPGHPPVILDGAHHPAGATALSFALAAALPAGTRVTMLFAAMADKDVAPMAAALAPRVRQVVTTRVPDSPRGGSPEVLAAHFSAHGLPATAIPDTAAALERACALAAGETLLVTGSLYLVGAIRRRLLRVVAS